MKTRILFSCQFSAAYGGVQHSMLDIVKHLDRSRFEPIVLCSPDGELPTLASKENARVLTVGEGFYWNYSPRYPINTIRDLYTVARQIVRLAREENIMIVHTFDGMVFLAASLARIFIKEMKVIWTDSGFNTYYHSYNRLVQRWCFQRVARVATISQVRQQQLLDEGLDPERSSVLPCGTDFHLSRAAEKPARPSPQVTIGLIARIAPIKNLELFLEAARLVIRQHPQTRFLIVGRPGTFRDEVEYHQQIINLIRTLDLTDHVTMREPVDDLPRLLNSMDVLVSSSHLETFGRVLIEAMALSKPVVATAVGGVPEVVTDGEVGYLVPPGDATAMADRISQLVADAELRKQMGKKGYERVLKNYDIRVITKRWEDLYEELLRS